MVTETPIDEAMIWTWLEAVPDPEIPILSVVDLGIIRNVNVSGDGVRVTITPTYSACPAMGIIAMDIETELLKHGINNLVLDTKITPLWTTDWLSEKGRARLEEYGIASPQQAGGPEHCPHCRAKRVEKVSQFGSTPCKAQWRCRDCLEPFDYFKCI